MGKIRVTFEGDDSSFDNLVKMASAMGYTVIEQPSASTVIFKPLTGAQFVECLLTHNRAAVQYNHYSTGYIRMIDAVIQKNTIRIALEYNKNRKTRGVYHLFTIPKNRLPSFNLPLTASNVAWQLVEEAESQTTEDLEAVKAYLGLTGDDIPFVNNE